MNKKTDRYTNEKTQNVKYNSDYEFDTLNTYSATEMTGLIPVSPTTEDEMDSYNDLFTFSSENFAARNNDN